MRINGIYYLTKGEIKRIVELSGKEKEKWDKRTVRDIDKHYVKKNKGIGSNRKDLRRRKFHTPWRDGEQKSFYEHKTKQVLTKIQRKRKRKLSRNKA